MAEAASVKAPILGKQAKTDLPKDLFTEPFHESLVHEAARADLAARRRGTHSSLTRGEVAMTTAKAWRQKGTGRARAGALSVPHRYGGGAAFGPKPRHYTVKVNRKARRKALRAALSVHADRGTVAVLEGSSFSEPATKQAADALRKWGADAPTLVLVSGVGNPVMMIAWGMALVRLNRIYLRVNEADDGGQLLEASMAISVVIGILILVAWLVLFSHGGGPVEGPWPG